jgi:hypothetical protein
MTTASNSGNEHGYDVLGGGTRALQVSAPAPLPPHTLINLRGLVFQLFPIRNSLWRRFQVWRQDNYYIDLPRDSFWW